MYWFSLMAIVFFQDQTMIPSSGGPLSQSQAAFDVKELELVLSVDPDGELIEGYAVLGLQPLESLDEVELDLVDSLTVRRITHAGKALSFEHEDHKISFRMPGPFRDRFRVRIDYGGAPTRAVRPPWQGGFNWSRTDEGKPWIGVTSQGKGGKIWFPCKAHPSDKIESLHLAITVPEPLYCAANGTLQKIEAAPDGRRTFHWRTDYPISTYNISLNIADYQILTRDLIRENKRMPVTFYVLGEYQKADRVSGDLRDYDRKKADLLEMALEYLDFFSDHYGEYPFETFKFAHTAYLGMEHQTINSYGNHFKIQDGYDFLLFHEMGHEWWGNKLTVADWADFWIHEGVCTYTSAVYLEEKQGFQKALDFFQYLRTHIANEKPLVPGRDLSLDEVYSLDLYYKGAFMIHALRFLLGKKTLDHVLETFALSKDHSYNNMVDTSDFIRHAETVSGRELDWFFQAYLRRAEPPKLTVTRKEGRLDLRWHDPSFEMPLEIQIVKGSHARVYRVPFPGGKAEVPLAEGATYHIDPDGLVLHTQEEDAPKPE